jgi:hypothetical protein
MLVRLLPVPMIVITSLLLSGCASVEGDFPSLSKRPYETDKPVVDTAKPPVLTSALPADLKQQTDALLARSERAHAAFAETIPIARSAAHEAAGSAAGSEAWVNAHMLLSRADGARADGVAALGEIDSLIAAQRDKGADTGLLSLLENQQARIASTVSADTAEINRLTTLIGV